MRIHHLGLLLALVGGVGLAVVAGLYFVRRPIGEAMPTETPERTATEGAAAIAPSTEPGAVSGTVRVFRTDAAAQDVPVRIRGEAFDETVRTDGEGIFVARVPSGVPLSVAVQAPDPYAPVVLGGVTVEPGRRTSLGTLYLERAFLVRGQVVDGRGRPVAGARVRARRPIQEESGRGLVDIVLRLGEARPPLEEVTADGEGAFVLASLTPGTYSFEAEAEGFAVGFRSGVVVTPEMAEQAVRIVLGPGASIEGTVKGAEGLPLEGARVTVLRFEAAVFLDFDFSPVQAVTDGEGRFAFTNLSPGRASVMVNAPGYPLWVHQAVDVGRQARLDIVLAGTAAVAGKVVDPAGDPVAGADVLVTLDGGGDGGGLGRGTTGEDGEYRIEHLPEGPVQMVVVQKKGYPTWPPDLGFMGMGRRSGAGTLRAGETLRVDVTLGRGATVLGHVLDAATSRPIAGAEIRVVSQMAMMGFGGGGNAVTDETGSFRLEGLGRGDHLLVVRAAGYVQPGMDPQSLMMTFGGGSGSSESLVKVEEEGAEIQREIRLARGARITGRVVTPDGRPVPAARVSVESDDQFAFFARFLGMAADPVLTGPDGRFTLGDLPSDQPVKLRAEAEGWVAGLSEPVTASSASGVEGVEIRLRTAAAVEGVVYGADGGPLAGASVAATAFREDQPWMAEQALQMAPPATTDADGRFRVGGLAPGRTILKTEAPGHVTKRLDDLQVTEGETLSRVEIRMQEGLVLAGDVRDEDGRPIAGASVFARIQGDQQQWVWDPNGTVQTGADGQFRLERLAADAYTLSIQKDGYIAEERTGIRSGTTGLSVVLRKGLEIQGRVLRPDGRPASGVWVQANGDGNGGSARTEADGEFTIQGLRAGRYQLTARPFGDPELRQVALGGVDAGSTGVVLRLEFGRTISGTVVDESGAPVEGASVWAVGRQGDGARPEAPSGGAATDAAGRFAIQGLDDGSYQIAVRQDGYSFAHSPVVAGGTEGLRLVLTRGGEEPPPDVPVPVPDDGR